MEARREDSNHRPEQNQSRRQTQEEEVASSIAPSPNNDRADHNTHKAHRRQRTLLDRREVLLVQHLHQRQNNTYECRERSARKLPKRGDHQHLDVSPAQRHRSHIDHLAIGTLTQTRQTLTQVIPLLDREM